jgi:hypothetical protein
LRHSFVSLLSDAAVPVEDIARFVGHRSTTVTETEYRKQLRPVITEGSQVMDTLFLARDRGLSRDSHSAACWVDHDSTPGCHAHAA